MRIRTLLFAAVTTIGPALLAAAPGAAMPLQSSTPAVAPMSAVQQVGYYDDDYYVGRRYHSPQYLWMRRHGYHSEAYMCARYGYCGSYGYSAPYRHQRHHRYYDNDGY